MKRLLFVIILLPILLILSFRSRDNINGYPGAQYTYSWDSKTTALSNISQLYNLDTSATETSFFQSKTLHLVNLDIRCSIRKTIVDMNSVGQLVCFEVISPVISIEQNGQPISSQKLQQELTRPILSEINTQGLIKMVRIDTSISQVAGGLIKEILSHMQFASPLKKSRTWKAEEENTAGVYLAKYQFLDSNKNGYTCSKINDGYVHLRSLVPDQTIKDNGRSSISIDNSGIMTGLEMQEAKTVLVNNDTISLSKGKALARLVAASRATNSEMKAMLQLASSAHYQERTGLSARLSDEKINRLTYSRTLGGDTYETLTSALRQTGADNAEAIDMLTSKFRSLAYLQPVHCQDMGKLLQTATVNSPEFKVLSEALNNAQTQASVDAIAGVVLARINEEDVLVELLPMLATTTAPTSNVETIIRQLLLSATSPVIRSTAELALGGLAYNFKTLDAGRSTNIAVYLLERMQMETDTIQKILVLANTGSAQVLPVLKGYFESQSVSAEVRQTAILGLRLITDRQADELLEKMLNGKDPVIAETAEQVIEFRKERAKDR